MRRATGMGLWVAVVLALAASAARAEPTQADVFKSIQNSVNGHDSVSMTGVVGTLAVVAGIVIVAVVVTQRQNRRAVVNGGWGSASSSTVISSGRATPGVVNNPDKLVRELMKEAGLTRAQVRQLESLNDRLAADDRAVQHLATLLLCPSLIAAARPGQVVRAA